jgi:hypothetical protein
MPTAYASDPLGIEEEAGLLEESPATPPGLDDDSRFQVAAGNHNPFYDFRWRDDPGGVGYFKLHTQYQVLQGQATGVALGLQAVTPAGREFDGLEEGPTILSPSVAWFHDVGNGTAIQGYVGKDVPTRARGFERPASGLQYGLAVQSPFPLAEGVPSRQFHVFVEALGRYRTAEEAGSGRAMDLGLLPGIHWRMNESWWLSSGVHVPLGASRPENLWQLTCSWQF